MDEASKLHALQQLGISDVDLCRRLLEQAGGNPDVAADLWLSSRNSDLSTWTQHQGLRPRLTTSSGRPQFEDGPSAPSVPASARSRARPGPRSWGRAFWATSLSIIGFWLKLWKFLYGSTKLLFAVPLGFLASVSRRLSNVENHSQFVSNFEVEYGSVHPEFFQGEFETALAHANRSYKFLLVYLHSPDHSDTPKFCKDVLCFPETIEFLNENVVLWAASVRSPVGFRYFSRFNPRNFPFCYVLTGLDPAYSGPSAKAKIGGPLNAGSFLNQLQEAIRTFGAILQRAKDERENRSLIEQQNSEFMAALQADQEAERKRAEEVERLKREREEEERRRVDEESRKREEERKKSEEEAERIKKMEEKKVSLGAEPEKGPDVTSIGIRFPTGERMARRFLKSQKLSAVFDFVDSFGLIPLTSDYVLVTSFPRTVFEKVQGELTLEAANLHPAASLLIIEK